MRLEPLIIKSTHISRPTSLRLIYLLIKDVLFDVVRLQRSQLRLKQFFMILNGCKPSNHEEKHIRRTILGQMRIMMMNSITST